MMDTGQVDKQLALNSTQQTHVVIDLIIAFMSFFPSASDLTQLTCLDSESKQVENWLATG